MTHPNEHDAALSLRRDLADVVHDAGSLKAFSIRSGISEPTVRRIMETGVPQTYATAARIDAATNGATNALGAVADGSRGDLYTREPGLSVLRIANSRGLSVSALLSMHGITIVELWSYAQARGGRSGDLIARVAKALAAMGAYPGPEHAR